jgi:hypothetical protein
VLRDSTMESVEHVWERFCSTVNFNKVQRNMSEMKATKSIEIIVHCMTSGSYYLKYKKHINTKMHNLPQFGWHNRPDHAAV